MNGTFIDRGFCRPGWRILLSHEGFEVADGCDSQDGAREATVGRSGSSSGVLVPLHKAIRPERCTQAMRPSESKPNPPTQQHPRRAASRREVEIRV